MFQMSKLTTQMLLHKSEMHCDCEEPTTLPNIKNRTTTEELGLPNKRIGSVVPWQRRIQNNFPEGGVNL